MLSRWFQRQGKLFWRILRTFMVLMIILIVMTSLLLLAICESIVTNQTYHNQLQALTQSQIRIQAALDKAYNITDMIFSDTDISYALYENVFQASKLRKAAVRLNSYRRMESSINSIYIYNGITQEVMVSAVWHGSVENKVFGLHADFVDKQLAEIITNIQDYHRQIPIARYMDARASGKLVTYPVYTFFFSKGNEKTSNVFVNFNASLFDLDTSEEIVCLLDGQGKVVVSNFYSLNDDLSAEDLWQKASASSAASGSFRAYADGEDMLVTYLNILPNFGWRLVQLTPYALVSQDVNVLRRLVILITVLVVAIGSVTILVGSSRVYVPIRKMNEELDQANSENSQLRRVEKQQLFRQLLQGRQVEPTRLRQMGFDNETMRLVVIRIRGASQLREQMTAGAFGQMTSEMALEMEKRYERYLHVQSLEMANGQDIALLLSGNASQLEETFLAQLVREGIETVGSALEVTLQPVVSALFNEIQELPSILAQLQDVMFRMIYSSQPVLYADHMPAANDDQLDDQMARESQLSSLLLSEQYEQAAEMTRDVLQHAQGCSYYIMDMIVSRLSFVYINVLRMLHSRYDAQRPFVMPDAFDLLQSGDQQALLAYFDKLLGTISQTASCRRSSRTQDLVQRVDEFLAQRLGDSTLNLEAVAEPIGMSAAYVGRVYKTSTGRTISETLNHMRMEKAKELLRTQRQWTVAQIAEQVGFTSNTYFSRAFKRDTGMTPNEYRTNQAAKEE